MTGSRHKGTVYPDVSVLRYLLADPDFRTSSPNNMGHKAVDYLVCAELKRSVSRVHIRQGLKNSNGHAALLAFLRAASRQAQKQAFVAVKRPGVVNSDLILIAASGPFWMWVPARRASILNEFSDTTMDDVLEDLTDEHSKDSMREEFNSVGFDNDDDLENDDIDGSYTTLFNTISPEDVFEQDANFPWSKVLMLDTKESEVELRSIVEALISVVVKEQK